MNSNCKHCREVGSKESITSIDPCLIPFVDALNNAGIETATFSCCGHGKHPAIITLVGGKVIRIFKDLESSKEVSSDKL